MHRIPGTIAGSVAAIAAVALLSACGDNDSTASQTPTLSTTASAAATSSAEPSTTVITPPSEADPTTTAELPAPAPEVTEPAAPTSAADDAFLAELSRNGINPADPSIALTTAQYICSAKTTGATDADIATFVGAMAGTDPAFGEANMDVTKAAQIYIAAANSTYC
ncbi:DUF732 domain-containing protein [Nocardia rhizosphaerae]|uniref:DUF732 domain-containing protein n=1 Tax=Nocardia rhizosphaerae TaxID=1691571 RepID=A0ABV8L033_9NOCA